MLISTFFHIAGKTEMNCLGFIENFVFKRYLGLFHWHAMGLLCHTNRKKNTFSAAVDTFSPIIKLCKKH